MPIRMKYSASFEGVSEVRAERRAKQKAGKIALKRVPHERVELPNPRFVGKGSWAKVRG